MTLKHTLELYDLPDGEDSKIGYRIISRDDDESVPITDVDYLMHSLSETLAHIGRRVTAEEKNEDADILMQILKNLSAQVIVRPEPLRDDYIQMNAYVALALMRGRCEKAFMDDFLDSAKIENAVIDIKETLGGSRAKH